MEAHPSGEILIQPSSVSVRPVMAVTWLSSRRQAEDRLNKFDESDLDRLIHEHEIASAIKSLTESQRRYLATAKDADAI